MEGNTVTVSEGKSCKAFVTVFDLGGNVVIPRTEVKAADDREAWLSAGYEGSLEPEGAVARADGLYLGFVSKPTDTSKPRLTHILKYKCDLCDIKNNTKN